MMNVGRRKNCACALCVRVVSVCVCAFYSTSSNQKDKVYSQSG